MTDEEVIHNVSTSKYFVDSTQNAFNYQAHALNSKLPQFSYYQHHLFSKPQIAKHYQELLVTLVQCELQKGNTIDWLTIANKMNG